MGYQIDFEGRFQTIPELKREHEEYLRAFAQTRRMKRDEKKAELRGDPLRRAVGLPIGKEGAYYVGEPIWGEWEEQRGDESIINVNRPPSGQPGLRCYWIPTKRDEIGVDPRTTQFDYYLEWLEYLIKHFLGPWGYRLNGTVKWIGSDENDRGQIIMLNDQMEVLEPGKSGVLRTKLASVMPESAIYQDILAQGRHEGAVIVVKRQLKRRQLNLPINLDEQLSQLSLQQLEDLAEALLDWEHQADLNDWFSQLNQ